MSTPRNLIFSYGLDLNLTLLHCVVGGPKPRCHGRSTLIGHQLVWNVSGHLPGIVRLPEAAVEGAITGLTDLQLQRLETSRLVPALYRWHRVPLTTRAKRRRWLPTLVPAQTPSGPSSPSFTALCEVVTGAIERGLSDVVIEQLLALRPLDRSRILSRTNVPWPDQPPLEWWELPSLEPEVAHAA